jgi:hypothetical protein
MTETEHAALAGAPIAALGAKSPAAHSEDARLLFAV